MRNPNDLSKRLFNFAIRVIKFLRTLPNTTEYKVIHYQLVKSSTSSGSNYEESLGASSRADFTNKVFISLKETRESNYWLRIISEISDKKSHELNYLVKESEELKNILGAIVTNTRSK
jgi:four helix bundle protein